MKTITTEAIHTPTDKLEVFLFNVGQGDHILLKFPTMEYGIIDFHYESSTAIAEPPSLSYFKELKRTLSKEEFEKITISFFCISHTDKDHVKGIAETIRWFDRNGIFIRDFWFGAARDRSQFSSFLREKVNSIIDTFSFEERLKVNLSVERFNNGVDAFFEGFDKWKSGGFSSERYKTEDVGDGEYLVEIRPLPLSLEKVKAVNMGPLGTQLDSYINNLNLDLVKEILKVKDNKNKVEKNLLSHILKIKFGEVNLLFGGDTEKDIWERCLAKYEKNTFVEQFGSFDSHFIKVSHHGSKNSSSSYIWEKIIPDDGMTYLGISAGRHNGYKHPHSETMSQIRQRRKDANILSTNICNSCIDGSAFDKEHHVWYDNFVHRNAKNYGKDEPNVHDIEINEIIDKTIQESGQKPQESQIGLFAYIFEVPDNLNEDIKVRVALSNVNRAHDCFFKDHQEGLLDCCGPMAKTL
ncbi:MAG TPA: hypothetical protein VGO50_02395 [Pyrinomonadaceae bacterium]|jgi:beta-lactamase superfamily II metal-dependent hydrolase|nr:hypothetical protein [Pyrinomonadaceae bacterium]